MDYQYRVEEAARTRHWEAMRESQRPRTFAEAAYNTYQRIMFWVTMAVVFVAFMIFAFTLILPFAIVDALLTKVHGHELLIEQFPVWAWVVIGILCAFNVCIVAAVIHVVRKFLWNCVSRCVDFVLKHLFGK